MKTLTSKILLTGCCLALCTLPVWAQGGEQAAPQAKATAMDRVISLMWWNQGPKVTSLELTDDQRTQLDALGRAYLTGRKQSTAQRDALTAFSEALKQNDFAEARAKAKALAEASAEPHLAQATMMIEALELLSAGQREKMASTFPGLLEGPWMRTGANLRQRRGAPSKGR
ncbi:MAG: Spy/CpxP family protein refolding chaperone [Acidobacteriota bacterium]